MQEDRFENIDVIRGICIVYMILGHVDLGTSFDHYIHAFHMPIFFILSGLFFKRKKMFSIKKIIKNTKKYLIPYLFFSIFFFLVSFFTGMEYIGFRESLKSYFTTNDNFVPIAGALWFLTAFYFCQIFISILDKIDNEVIFYLMSFLIFLIGIYVNNIFNFRLWLSISSSFVGVGLVCLGYIIRKYNFFEKFQFTNNIFLVLFLFVINMLLILKTGYVNMRTSIFPNLYLFLFNLIISFIVYLNLSNLIVKYQVLKCLKALFIWFGKYSMIFLCLNQYIVKSIKLYISFSTRFMQNCIVSVISLLILFILSILIAKTKIKKIFGYV